MNFLTVVTAFLMLPSVAICSQNPILLQSAHRAKVMPIIKSNLNTMEEILYFYEEYMSEENSQNSLEEKYYYLSEDLPGHFEKIKYIKNNLEEGAIKSEIKADFNSKILQEQFCVIKEKYLFQVQGQSNETAIFKLACAIDMFLEAVIKDLANTIDEETGFTALIMAASEDDDNMIKLLLQRFPALKNKKDDDKVSPLIHAVMLGHTKAVDLLFDGNEEEFLEVVKILVCTIPAKDLFGRLPDQALIRIAKERIKEVFYVLANKMIHK